MSKNISHKLKPLKGAGWGINVNKSKATKTYPLEVSVFPKRASYYKGKLNY